MQGQTILCFYDSMKGNCLRVLAHIPHIKLVTVAFMWKMW